MKIVLRSCSECPFLFYKKGLLSCTFGINITTRQKNDPRFPINCPLKDRPSSLIEVDPIKTCEGCCWAIDGFCYLYCGKLTKINDKLYRVSICIDNEKA